MIIPERIITYIYIYVVIYRMVWHCGMWIIELNIYICRKHICIGRIVVMQTIFVSEFIYCFWVWLFGKQYVVGNGISIVLKSVWGFGELQVVISPFGLGNIFRSGMTILNVLIWRPVVWGFESHRLWFLRLICFNILGPVRLV